MMKMKLGAAFVLAMMACQAHAKSGCSADGREEWREYKAVLHPIITARFRSLRNTSLIERTSVISLSIRKDGVVRSSAIVKSSNSPPHDARIIGLFPAGLQFPPLPACYGKDAITLILPVQFRPDRAF